MAERIIPNTAELAERERKAIEELKAIYQGGVIDRLDTNHKQLGQRLTKLYRDLGYETRTDMFEALGFEVKINKKKATVDPEAIIAELMDRYDGVEKPASLGILTHENPDLAGKLKTIGSKATKIFGQTLAAELKDRGLISGSKAKTVTEDDIQEMLDALAQKYARAAIKPRSIAELRADNPEYKAVIAEFNGRCRLIYGKTPKNMLVELGIFERPKNATIDASDEEIEAAIDSLGELVMSLEESQKPNTLSELQKAYPDLAAYVKAGKAKGLTDKEPLQKLGILAANKTLLRREGIRGASAETLADDYLKLGRKAVIQPGDDDATLLPPYVVGVDFKKRIELREFIATVIDEPARSLNVGDAVAFDVVQEKREWGDPYKVVRLHTAPPVSMGARAIYEDAIEHAATSLSSFVGGEVVTAAHIATHDIAQIRVRYLANLRGSTIAYLFRAIGIVSDKDLAGSMEWRFRLRQQTRQSVGNSALPDDIAATEDASSTTTEVESAATIEIAFANPEKSPLTFGTSVKGEKGNTSVASSSSNQDLNTTEQAADGATANADATSEQAVAEPMLRPIPASEPESAIPSTEDESPLTDENQAQKEREDAERLAAEEAERQAEEERKRLEAEEAERKRIEEEERKRAAEEERLRLEAEEAERKRIEEEKRQAEEEARKAEEAKREERRQAQARLDEFGKKIQDARMRQATRREQASEPTDAERENEKLQSELADLIARQRSLGLFAFSDKKAMKAAIQEKEVAIGEVKSRIPKERSEAEAKAQEDIAHIDEEVRQLESEAAPFMQILAEEIAERFNGKKPGDTVTFGSYKQDTTLYGATPTPIEWIILNKKNNELLLLSKYVLAHRQFNETQRQTKDCKSSDLFKWLKDDFSIEAFSAVEKRFLKNAPFILSEVDLTTYLRTNAARQCKATDYAQKQGAEVATYHEVRGYTFYWVATSDSQGFYNVNAYGNILGGSRPIYIAGATRYFCGQDETTKNGVRPAIRITLPSNSK